MERHLSSGETIAISSPSRQTLQAKRGAKFTKGSSSSNGSSKRKSLQILQPSANHQGRLVGVDGVITSAVKTKKKSSKRKVLGDGNEGRPRKLSRSNDDPPQENETLHGNKGTSGNGRDASSGKSNRTGDRRVEKTQAGQEQHQKFAIYEDPSSTSSDSDQEKIVKTAEEEAYELMVQEPAPDSYWKQLAEQRREALADTLKENEELHDEVAELKAENARLKIMADQAEYLASVVQELMGEEDDSDKSQEDETTQESKTAQSDVEQSDNSQEDNQDKGTENTDSERSDGSDL